MAMCSGLGQRKAWIFELILYWPCNYIGVPVSQFSLRLWQSPAGVAGSKIVAVFPSAPSATEQVLAFRRSATIAQQCRAVFILASSHETFPDEDSDNRCHQPEALFIPLIW